MPASHFPSSIPDPDVSYAAPLALRVPSKLTLAEDERDGVPLVLLTPTATATMVTRFSARAWVICLASFLTLSLLYTTRLALPRLSPLILAPSPPPRLLQPHPALDLLLPAASPAKSVWEERNARAIRELLRCVGQGNCGERQAQVVLVASFHFGNALEGHVSGEDIWAASIDTALSHLGYTYLYSPSLSAALTQYRLFPSLVPFILAESSDIVDCFSTPTCLKSTSNPTGLPIWKLFAFHFWAYTGHPLGARWTLSPERYGAPEDGANTYLGYSVESACTARPLVPHAQRLDQAYILGKRLSYFHTAEYAWSPPILARVRSELAISLVAGLVNDTTAASSTGAVLSFPEEIDNFGRMPKEEFYALLAQSRVLVGTGMPRLSPSPYEALCLGVPFVNPIMAWDEKRPFHKASWNTQHDGLKEVGEPWVYHVRRDDGDGLVEAVRRARSTPIDRYIPPEMRQAAVERRLEELVGRDWRGEAGEVLGRRERGEEEGPVFEL